MATRLEHVPGDFLLSGWRLAASGTAGWMDAPVVTTSPEGLDRIEANAYLRADQVAGLHDITRFVDESVSVDSRT
jgi:hypothetical protein